MVNIDQSAGYCFIYLQNNFKTSAQSSTVKLNILKSFVLKDTTELQIPVSDVFLAFLAFRVPILDVACQDLLGQFSIWCKHFLSTEKKIGFSH